MIHTPTARRMDASVRTKAVFFLASGMFVLRASSTEIPQACFDEASRRFPGVRAEVLRAHALQESSGRCKTRHPSNNDGSYDIGCMGINSSWLPMLHRKFGITENDLYEPCTNVHVGAWIAARNVRQFGDTWRAIGAYNARSEEKRSAYSWKIYKHLDAAR
jgi:hypothetical protein